MKEGRIVDPKPQRAISRGHELREQRKQLRGRSRQLHERLAEVCEDFAFGELTLAHKRQILIRELQYLLDCYKDDECWKDMD